MLQPEPNLYKLKNVTPTKNLKYQFDAISSFSESTTSAQDDDIFPNCSNDDVEELKTILSSQRRRKEDLQFLSRKLKDIPIFNAIIKKLNIDENEESLSTLFNMLKLEQYEAKSLVYKQGSRTSSSAYIILQGTAYKFDDPSPVKPKDEKPQQKRKSLLRRVSGLESKENILENIPSFAENLEENRPNISPIQMRPDNQNDKILEELEQVLDMEDEAEDHPVKLEQQDSTKQLKDCLFYKLRSARFCALEKIIKKEGFSSVDDFEEIGVKPEELTPGDHFGQKALWSMQRRDHTIITKTQCELIVLTADAFRTIKRTAQLNKKRLVEFLMSSFPSIDSESDPRLYRALQNTFTVKTFAHNNSIIAEGQEDSKFYIVYEGECELLKKVVINNINETGMISPRSNRPLSGHKGIMTSQLAGVENIGITTLKEGSFFGEELLFSRENIYCYTVKVISSEAKVLCFDADLFLNQFSKTTAVQLKEYYHQRQKRHFQILSQNLSLRGYSLDEKTFLEQNRVVLGPQKESKLRSYYNYQTKIVRETPSPVPSSSQLLLQGIREKIDTKYAHKLHIDSPFSVSRSSRPGIDPSVASLARVKTPDSMDSDRKNNDSFDSPIAEEKQSNSTRARPRLSLKVVKNLMENNTKRADNFSPSQFFVATEKARKATIAPQTGERGQSRPGTSQMILKTDPDEGSKPMRLKFLRAADPKKGLKSILGGKLTPKKQDNREDIGVSGSPRANYAELVKIRYKTKFRETNESNDVGAEFNKTVLYNNNMGKSKDHFFSFEAPALTHSKSAFKISTINMHVKHDTKKVHPLQRNRKRAGIVGKTEF